MKVIVTTNPGIEDIVEKEVKEKIKRSKIFGKFLNLSGNVFLEIKQKNFKKLFELRSIYHIIEFLNVFDVEKDRKGLEEIYSMLKNMEIPYIEKARSFRITSSRIGEHEYTSIQVQKWAGQAIVDKYSKKVDLKNYDLNIIVNVVGKKCWIGVLHTFESLHKRFKRFFNHPAAIKPPLAYAMIKISELKEGETLLDPFCGGGTIPIEAASIYDGKINVYGSDKNENFIKGAIENARYANVLKYIKFKVVDARFLDKNFENIDKIVTNPPYGVRLSEAKNLKSIYKDFLNSSYSILNSKIVFITLRSGSFRDLVFKTKKYKIVEERVVESGGLYPHIFVLEKI